jgi:hypothetical protein
MHGLVIIDSKGKIRPSYMVRQPAVEIGEGFPALGRSTAFRTAELPRQLPASKLRWVKERTCVRSRMSFCPVTISLSG